MRRINHWIDGQRRRRHVGTHRRPCATRPPASSRPRSTRVGRGGRRAPSPRRAAAFPAWRATSLSRRAEVMFRFRELVDANRKEIAAAGHQRARQGAVRRHRRGGPRPGERRVRLRRPAPAQGRLQRAGVDRRRRLLDPPAARRRRRHHAVQLPGDGARCGCSPTRMACGNTFVLKPSEKDPSVVAASGRPAAPGRAARRRVQRRAGRQGRRRPPARAPRRRRRSASSAPRRSPGTSTRPAPQHGKRVQALGGAKNHMVVLPDADIDMAADAAVSAGYGSAGERCMAISVVVAVGDVADPLVDGDQRAARPTIKVGPGTDPTAEMGPLITREHRDKVAGYLDAAASEGAERGRRRPRRADRRRRRASSSARRCVDNVDRRHDAATPTRSSARCCRWSASTPTTRRSRLVNDNPYGNGTRHLHPRRRRGPPVPVRRRCAAWSASTCRSRCRWRTTASAAGRRRCSATCTCTARTASHFYTRTKVVTSRWPDPATSRGRPRLPAESR